MKEVTVYTDGGCLGNPGPGGWAAVLLYGGRMRQISGGEPATTNNRMELRAAIEALAALNQPCQVRVFSDSRYVRDGITLWIKTWKRRGWIGRNKQPIKNVDLWRLLDEAAGRHRVAWEWLRGHAGHEYNERCHELARVQIDAMQRAYTPARLGNRLETFRQEQSAATHILAPSAAATPSLSLPPTPVDPTAGPQKRDSS